MGLTLRLTLALLPLWRLLRSPLTWWERRVDAQRQFQRELAEIQAQAQARTLEALGRTMTQVVSATLAAQQEQTRLLQTWLDGFKVTERLGSTTVTEADEVALDRERYVQELAAQQGLLERVDWSPQDTVNWMDAFGPIPR